MEPIVSLKTQPERLVETEASTAILNFTLSEPPPAGGITLNLKATNLSDFSLGQAQVTGGKITLEPALQQVLQQALNGTREADVPGAAIAIVSPAGSWFGTSGVANIQTNRPLQPNDRFQIGSITKTFVATTVLQLVQEGRLSLDDKLTKLLPDRITKNIPNAESISLKQLLQHTSGITDYTDVLFTQAATNPGVFLQEWQPEELVALIKGEPPLVKPGEAWRYSSTNFILAGLIVEATTGNSIAREIRDRILTPLNLTNTFFATEETIPGGVVSGYWDFDRDGRLNDITGASLSWAWAAGAMVSNTQDLDAFARGLFKGNLLQPETLAQMLTTIPTNEPDNYSSYGLGVGTIESPNRFWYIHRGQTLGYRSNMWYEPKSDLTYIELINGFSRDNLSQDVLRPYRAGIVDDVLNFTITSQTAQIRLPVNNDGIAEGTEISTFTLEPAIGYTVDKQTRSGQFSITDNRTSSPSTMPQVSFNTLALTLDGNDNIIAPALIKNPDTGVSVLSFIFTADQPIPAEGLIITVNSDIQFRDNFAFLAERPFTQGGELIGAIFNDKGEATGFKFKMTQPNALFNLRPQDNGSGKIDRATFTLQPDSTYTVNAQAKQSSVTFYDKLNQVPSRPNRPEVSISSDGVILNERHLTDSGSNTTNLKTGRTTQLTIELNSPPPAAGILVYIKGDRPARGGILGRALSEFDLFNAKVTGATFPTPDATANGFYIRMFEQKATLTLGAFADDNEIEGIEDVTFSLQATPDVVLSSGKKSVTITTIDNLDAKIQVSLTTSPATLIESENTISIHTFTLSATPPKDGITLTVSAPNLNEFDLSKIQVEGGTITAVRNNGFDLKATAKIATIKLPVAKDSQPELAEKASFTLLPGAQYQINPDAKGGSFTIVDLPEFAPPSTTITEPNDTIAKAVDTKLSNTYSNLSFTSTLDFEFRNSYEIDGKTIYIDASEDVDFYKVNLKAGDFLKLDIDGNQFDKGRKLDSVLRLFDATGKQLAINDDGAARDEIFEAKWASYLEFTAPQDGAYYIGVSLYENRTYDPNRPGSGMGSSSSDPDGYGTAEYKLNLALNDLTAFMPKATVIPVNTEDAGPKVALQAVQGVYQDNSQTRNFGVLDQVLSETRPRGVGSALTLVLTAQGEIPKGGVEVIVNSDANLTDYFGDLNDEFFYVPYGGLLNDKPFSRGGEFLDAVYDSSGRVTGFKFKLTEQFATITLTPSNRVVKETDGNELVTFTLVDGIGYQTNSQLAKSTVTFVDDYRDRVFPSVLGPEVSLEFDKTELIESEETKVTLTLKADRPIPPGGLQVYVSGNVPDALNEFNIFKAEFTGGVPIADGAVSGFYFLMTEQTAKVTLPIFNSTDIVEGIEQIKFELKPGNNFYYVPDPVKNSATLTIKDTPTSKIQLNLSAESAPLALVGSTPTEVVLKLRSSVAIPAGGLDVTYQFTGVSLSNLSITGGTIITTAITDPAPGQELIPSGLVVIRMTDAEVTIRGKASSPPILSGQRQASITLLEQNNYQIDAQGKSVNYLVVNTAAQVPVSTEESNDTLATAIATGLTASNSRVKFDGEIAEYDIGEGNARIRVDGTEDVDLYKMELKAGDKLTIDVDAAELKSKLQFAQIRVFDAEGKEVLKTGGNYFQAAPEEVFSVFNDTFAEFVAAKPGTYYVGISNIGNDYYDPKVVASGSGWIFPGAGIGNGKYSVQFDLKPAAPVQPEVSFSLSPNQLNEAQGTTLVFNFNVKGTIPKDGLTVTLKGDSANTLLELLGTEVEFESPTETELEFFPENVTVKGGKLGTIDPDFSSFTFTITEANASISLKVFDDIFEEGTETFRYTLEVPADSSYKVSSTANSGSFTIVDGVPGGIGPKVGITANQTALYEDENDRVTLTFKVDGTIPVEGLIVFVDSTQGYGSIGALGQFDGFNTEAVGGAIVGADEDASGFYFRINQSTATLTIPIFADQDVEEPVPYVFSLVDGEQYQIDRQAAAVNLIIGDSAPFNTILDAAKKDYLLGTAGKDAIYGLDGFNSLYGGGDRDVIVGGKDGDLIFGGTGDDLIVGGKGQDLLFGEAGMDTFAFRKGDGSDIISDFKVGEDKIGVFKGEIQTSDISFEQSGTATLVKLKSTGETLAYLQGVTASQLTSSSIVEVVNQPITPGNTYGATILVSNRQEYQPQIYDPTFALGWGLAIRPAGFGGHFWVTANGSGASYEYVGDVNIGKPNAVPLFTDDLKIVKVPGPNGTQGTPTGVVFNGSNNFVVTQKYEDLDGKILGADITGPSRFLFATDTGTISGWTEIKNPDGSFTRSLNSKIVIDNSARGDQYFGLAVNPVGDRLFIANFGVNPNVQVFDGSFKDITASFNGFANPFVGNDGFQPGEYAPFNIQVLEAPGKNASVFVAYAKTQEDPDNPGQLFVGEEEAGSGLGRIAEFDLTGKLIKVWNDNGLLNSPWGFAYAPSDFGGLSNTLLVSNFSDGTITAFDPVTGNAIDYLRDETAQPVVARGIWGILFGNGASLGDTNSLYAAIGPEDLGDGVFARWNYRGTGSNAVGSAGGTIATRSNLGELASPLVASSVLPSNRTP